MLDFYRGNDGLDKSNWRWVQIVWIISGDKSNWRKFMVVLTYDRYSFWKLPVMASLELAPGAWWICVKTVVVDSVGQAQLVVRPGGDFLETGTRMVRDQSKVSPLASVQRIGSVFERHFCARNARMGVQRPSSLNPGLNFCV